MQKIVKYSELESFEIERMYEILSKNLKERGVEISNSDKTLWLNSLESDAQNSTFILCFLNEKIEGFAITQKQKGKVWVSEVEISKKYQRTKVIYYLLKELESFFKASNISEVYFNINKENTASLNAFSHLGAILEKENFKSYTYKFCLL